MPWYIGSQASAYRWLLGAPSYLLLAVGWCVPAWGTNSAEQLRAAMCRLPPVYAEAATLAAYLAAAAARLNPGAIAHQLAAITDQHRQRDLIALRTYLVVQAVMRRSAASPHRDHLLFFAGDPSDSPKLRRARGKLTVRLADQRDPSRSCDPPYVSRQLELSAF